MLKWSTGAAKGAAETVSALEEFSIDQFDDCRDFAQC
jgi:hypothetical protein